MSVKTSSLHRVIVLCATSVCLVLAAMMLTGLVGTPVARAAFGVASFDGEVLDPGGSAASQAGLHPYTITNDIEFNSHFDAGFDQQVPDADVKDIVVELPPGFIGDPTAAPHCEVSDLVDKACSINAQVGVVRIGNLAASVFNITPPPGAPGQFGFVIENTPALLTPSLRSGTDYGVTVSVLNVSQAIPILTTTLTLWGVPADPSHDPQRCAIIDGSVEPPACTGHTFDDRSQPHSAGILPTPFLRLPTSCTPPSVGLETKLSVDSWDNPGVFEHASFFSHLPAPDEATQIGTTGCDIVPFDPSLNAQPGSTRASTPSGWTFDLSLPQNENPDGLAQADVKKAVVTLPLGVRISPSSAHGLQGCSEAQIGLDRADPATCPDASKVGTLTIDTPLLDEPLTGAIYVASPEANPFSSLLAIYLVAEGPGLIVKLPGEIALDPLTGQVTTTFDNNPQLPFSNLHLEFKTGPRSPLVNPPACGTYPTQAELTSWSGKTVNTTSSFTVDLSATGGACAPLGFSPDFTAGTVEPVAGATTSFLLRLSRGDDDQQLKTLEVRMPRGLLGKIASTELCGEAAANAGTCGEASLIGSVIVGAGAGSNPFYITNGRAYITGPFKGAPFGLSIVVPAVAGPFDLGNVVVRAAIFVDRHTAALKVVSDELPTILQGIPLDVRDVRVTVDRDGFIVNPTSCKPKRIGGTIGSTTGATAQVTDKFRVTNCAALPLRPRMRLRVGGKGHLRAGGSTPLTATLRQAPGESNLRSVRVVLPKTLNARLDVVEDACTRAQFDAGDCEDARAGSAVAVTPLLDEPLRGGAYFVENGNPLPDLMVALRGQVDFDLTGRVTIPGGKRLSTTFTAPDVPIKRFTLRLVAGKQGPVGVATGLCSREGRKAKALVRFRGQTGELVRSSQRLKIAGCPKRR